MLFTQLLENLSNSCKVGLLLVIVCISLGCTNFHLGVNASLLWILQQFLSILPVIRGYLTRIISSNFSSLAGLFLFGSTLYWCSKVVLCKFMDYSNLHVRWNRHGKWNASMSLVLEFQRDYQNNGIKVIVIRADIYLLFWQLHAVNCHKVGACSWTPRKLTGFKSSKLVLRRFMTRMYAVI